MKRLIIGFALAALSVGCATDAVAQQKQESAKPAVASAPVKAPEQPVQKDPNPYSDYGSAMSSDKAHPMAYEWQKANDAEIDKATSPETLSSIVDNDELAKQLLDGVGEAYETDPVVATKIAAISQLVMCPKCPKAPERRKKWTALLLGAAKDGKTYRAMFALDQLRWCGCKCNAKTVREIGVEHKKQGRTAVADFAEQVAKELEAAQ